MDECEVIGPGPASWGDTHGPCRDAKSQNPSHLLAKSRRCPWFQLMWTGLDPTPTKRAKAQTVRGFQTQNQTRSFHVAGCDGKRKSTTSTGYEISEAAAAWRVMCQSW